MVPAYISQSLEAFRYTVEKSTASTAWEEQCCVIDFVQMLHNIKTIQGKGAFDNIILRGKVMRM